MEKLEQFTEQAWPFILLMGFSVAVLAFAVLCVWQAWADYAVAKRRVEKICRREAKFGQCGVEGITVHDPEIVK